MYKMVAMFENDGDKNLKQLISKQKASLLRHRNTRIELYGISLMAEIFRNDINTIFS